MINETPLITCNGIFKSALDHLIETHICVADCIEDRDESDSKEEDQSRKQSQKSNQRLPGDEVCQRRRRGNAN